MSGTFGGGGDDNGGFLSGLINALSNPETFGTLSGLTRGAAMAAMPSRMPIPTGAALGLAASGMQEGRNEALRGQLIKQQGIASQLGNIGTEAQLPVMLSRAHMLQQIYSDPNLMGLVRQGLGGSSAPMGVPSMGQSPSLQMSPSVAAPAGNGSVPAPSPDTGAFNSWASGVPHAANNPLNIRFAGQPGAVNTGGFAAFPSPETGAAATNQLFDKYADSGVNTLSGLISKWAPPSENNTPAYIATVSKATGFAPDDKIDLKDPAVRSQVQQAMATVEGNKNAAAPTSAPSQSVTPQNAMETAQQYEQQANRLELLKSLGLPAMGDPATLRSAAQQFRGVALAGPTEQAKAAVGLQYAGPMALAKAQNSPIELRIGGMAGMPTGNGNFNWIKNPELRTITTPTGAKQDVYMSPPLPGSAPGTLGTAEPVVGPGGQQAMSELPPQVTQGREHAVNEFLTKDQDAYQAAQNTQAWLNQIDSAADTMNKSGPTFMTGPFAPQRLAIMAHVNDLASSMGINRPFDPSAIASWEEMKKATTTAGFELSSHYEGHARQAAQTILNATSAVPAQTNSPQGLKLVSAGIREGAQSAMDTHQYKQEVYNGTQGAGLERAETDFYQAHPAQQYANRAISVLHPFSVSKPEDMAKYLPGTFVTIPKISPTTGKPMVVQVPQRQETINGFPVTLSVPSYLQQQAQGAAPNASP